MNNPRPLHPGRRQVIGAIGAMLAAGSGLVRATDEWPNKPIRFIVPTPPGSGPDVDTRQMATHLGTLLGQPVVIENKPGAAARIAIETATRAAPDGYTFLVGTPGLVTAPALYSKLPYDVQRDLMPVSLVSTTSYALTVNAALPARTPAEYVAQARANPGGANVATYGAGTIPHLAGAWFASLSGADLKFIHYNTTTPFADLMAGQTQAIFDALLPVAGAVKSGKLRVLGLSGKQRHPLMPDVPTFAEAGMPAFDPLVWIGVMAPTGTPKPIVDKLSAAIAQVARMPDIVAQRRDGGSESVGNTPAQFSAFLDSERGKWGKVIQQLALRLD